MSYDPAYFPPQYDKIAKAFTQDPEHAALALFETQVRELSLKAAAACETLFMRVIEALGYVPDPAPGAEWRRHIEIQPGPCCGRDLIVVDGVPLWAIVSELESRDPGGNRFGWRVRLEAIR